MSDNVSSHAILFRFFGQSNCETDALRKRRAERAEHIGNLWNGGIIDPQKSGCCVRRTSSNAVLFSSGRGYLNVRRTNFRTR